MKVLTLKHRTSGATSTRYVAEWIIDMDDSGTDETARSVHSTFEAAKAAAIAGSKAAGCIEWVRIREQQWVPDITGGRWDTVRRWTGDYDAVEEST